MNIIQQLEDKKIIGKGCNNFPTNLKWQKFKEQKGKEKFLIVNVSEGTPNVFKDEWVLKNRLEIAFSGINYAMKFFKIKQGYFYIKDKYYKKYKNQIDEQVAKIKNMTIFVEKACYIGGEETALINNIEGKRITPRLRPPFTIEVGLFGKPTLVNNLETFYDVGKIIAGNYENKRLICVSGDNTKKQVFELDRKLTIKEILIETDSYPDFDFFVQIGGYGTGIVLNRKQLDQTIEQIGGLGSIVVFDMKRKPKDLILEWISFFKEESCGKCVPCREGTFRLVQILQQPNVDWKLFKEVMFTLEKTSFCGLGKIAPLGIQTYLKNIMDYSKI